MEGTFVNQPNIQLVYETAARILGERYGAQITVTARPKPQCERRGKIPYVGEAEISGGPTCR